MFDTVIGLEIHTQLATKSKLFCRCPVNFGDTPNSNTCPVCLGLPGALPTINEKAVEFAIMLGLATNCSINLVSEFARKNYFYPDLPKAYQISQYDLPICENGYINLTVNEKVKKIRITRIHLEEDAGKLIHDDSGSNISYVDLNRAGTPLLEIVTEPDLSSSLEAKLFFQKIHSIVTAIGVCSGDLEKGNLRCDANISLKKANDTELGIRTETKNLNSFRFIQQAIDYEIARQTDLLLDGKVVEQETRLYNPLIKQTFLLRKKEEADDYRYFPCPDLPLVQFSQDWVERLKNDLPELPEFKIAKYKKDYNLSQYDADFIIFNGFTNFFESALKLGIPAKTAANWLMSDISKYLNENKKDLHSTKLTAEKLTELISFIDKDIISNKIAKSLLVTLFEQDVSLSKIIEEKGLAQLSDTQAIKDLCSKILNDNPNEVAKYKAGKDRVFGFFVGQIMQKTQGKANPKLVNQYLKELLQS